MKSLLKRLLSGSAELPPAAEIRLTGSGGFRLMVVGEASYQDNIEQICGGRTTESVDRMETAHLILENSNPYDRNAVSVEINGLKVGYLNREDAKAYRTYLESKGQPNAIGTCHANIRGGWKRSKKEQGHFGVRLDFDLYG
jgi:HIRAN domain